MLSWLDSFSFIILVKFACWCKKLLIFKEKVYLSEEVYFLMNFRTLQVCNVLQRGSWPSCQCTAQVLKFNTEFGRSIGQVSISPAFYEQLFVQLGFAQLFSYLQFGFVIFWWKNIGAIAAHNFFVKLAIGKVTMDIIQ